MKIYLFTLCRTWLVALLLLLTFHCSSYAIEGLQLSVVNSNSVLAWPSKPDGSETFLVQYRSNLVSGAWLTVTDALPASSSNAITTFIDSSNLVSFPVIPAGWTNAGDPGDPTPPGPGDTNSTSGGNTNAIPATTGFYRVVRDGVHLWGLTNGMVVSNVLITPIEFAVGSTDQIVGVTFYDTNSQSPVTGASAQPNGNGWLLVWDTTKSFNGGYALQAELNFASDPSVVSQPVAVTVNNVISFPNYFSQVYGDWMWIYATTLPDAAYELDVYDESTNYLGTFDGFADDTGTISFLWNLVDADGNLSASTNFSGVFTVDTSGSQNVRPQVVSQSAKTRDFLAIPPTMKTIGFKSKTQSGPQPRGSDPTPSAKNFWVKEPNWTPNDNWVVAYGLFSASSAQVMYDKEMIAGGPGGSDGGVLGTLDQHSLHGNISPGNNAQNEDVFTMGDAASRAQLLSYLADPRYENFYFFGHGNDSEIGSYNDFDLTQEQIADALLNIPLSSKMQMEHAAMHPYRLVFIDACDTGKGNFCEAFGIPALTVSTNFFASAGVESRAYVGYKTIKLNLNEFTWFNYTAMIGWFLTDWLDNVDVQTCVGNAQHDTHVSGVEMNSSAVIYGAYDLKRLTFTRAH